jgi:hypothetical protein
VTRRRLLLIALAALLLAGGALWWLLRPTDTRRIRKRVRSLQACIERAPDESNAAMILKRQRLEGLFAELVVVEVPEKEFRGRYSGRDLANQVFRYRMQCRHVFVTLYETEIRIADESESRTAAVRLVGRVRAQGAGGWEDSGIRQVLARLVKRDGAWRFELFRQAPPLEK